jgi:hypothetical protein
MGFVEPIDREAGVFRYVRPIVINSSDDELQSVILRHYQNMTDLCHAAAMTSDMNYSMLTLNMDDIISIEFG